MNPGRRGILLLYPITNQVILGQKCHPRKRSHFGPSITACQPEEGKKELNLELRHVGGSA
jgi:hypothetical protein